MPEAVRSYHIDLTNRAAVERHLAELFTAEALSGAAHEAADKRRLADRSDAAAAAAERETAAAYEQAVAAVDAALDAIAATPVRSIEEIAFRARLAADPRTADHPRLTAAVMRDLAALELSPGNCPVFALAEAAGRLCDSWDQTKGRAQSAVGARLNAVENAALNVTPRSAQGALFLALLIGAGLDTSHVDEERAETLHDASERLAAWICSTYGLRTDGIARGHYAVYAIDDPQPQMAAVA